MIQGNLDELHLGDLLQWFHMGRLSGRLHLIDHPHTRHLDFLDGRIVFVSSTVPEERLASWLATEGLLPVSALHRMLALSLVRRQPFTGLLLDRARFSPDQLRASLTRLAETIISRLLTKRSLRFALDPSYPVRQLLGLTLEVQPTTLMMEAARRSDERPREPELDAEPGLAFSGDGGDALFWELIRTGIPEDEPVDGDEVFRLQHVVRNVLSTLGEWLASSPGLVPVPPVQATRLRSRADGLALVGLPHIVWNQMILACALHSPHLRRPESLAELHDFATELGLWRELGADERWQRPQAGLVDEFTSRSTADWCRAAAAAAPHLGVDPDAVRLAVHLAVVPTDLVLWVLAMLPLPHRRLRETLLRELPRRLGEDLSRRADFPAHLRALFDQRIQTRVGVSVDLGRQQLAAAHVWPATVPSNADLLLELGRSAILGQAEAAARTELARPVGAHDAVV